MIKGISLIPQKYKPPTEITTNTSAHKLVNLEEIHKLLDTYILPILNQKEIESLNRPITRSDVEAAINSLPIKKFQDQMGSQPNSNRHSKNNWYQSSDTIPQDRERRNPP